MQSAAVLNRYMGILLGLSALLGLYLTSRINYLLFHSLVEVFSIVIACGIFMVAWNSRRFLDNNYVLFLGIAYLFVGTLDLIHTLAYKGMGVFPDYGANLPTQLWIAARYVESFSLLIAPLVLHRKRRANWAFLGYAGVTALLLGTIFAGVFPDCFVEGVGLTPFKKISEYIISLILLASATLLWQRRREFDRKVLRWLLGAIIVTMGSEMAFTLYVDVYGFFNLAGHLLKVASFYLIYKVFIETGLVNSYNLLFRNLKQSEEALRRERDFAESLIETAQAIVLVLDTEGRIVRINPYMEEISGYSMEEVQGKDWFTTFLPERDHSRIREMFLKAVSDIQTRGNTNSIVTKDGRERDIEWYDKTLKDTECNVVGVLAIGQDMTERRQMEEALRESEVRFRDLYQEAPLAYLSVGIDGRIQMTNQRAGEMFGFTVADLVGRPLFDLYADAAAGKEKASQVFSRFRAGEEIRGEELEMRRVDGSSVWINLTVRPIRDAEGGIVASRSIVEDITERRQAEEALRASERKYRGIVEQSQDGIVLINEEGIIIEWNRSQEQVAGMKGEEVLGRPMWDMLFQMLPEERRTQATLDELMALIKEGLRTGQGIWLSQMMEGKIQDSDGARRPTQQLVYPIETEQGFMLAAITRDITERKRVEEQLHRYNQELEEMVNERTARIQEMERQRAEMEKLAATGRMAARIAHEVNNPLAGIANSFLLIEDAIPNDHPYYEYVDRIKREIERIARIVRQMFDLYRPEKEMSVEFVVAETVRDVVTLCGASSQTRDISIVVEITDASATATLPEGWLRQILFNVLQNAVDVSPPGASVKVSMEVTQDVLTILVADQGTGIPEEARSRILEPFFTTKENPSQRGLGLGLSVSASLAETMGGSIDFESEVGMGTTFRISLPTMWGQAKDVD